MTVANVLELVARMRRDAFSRNRNFDAFATADADASRARRIWRFLRSIEADLIAAGPRIGTGVHLAVEEREEGSRKLTFIVPDLKLTRVAIMSAEEWELLREHPDARAVLDAATGNLQ